MAHRAGIRGVGACLDCFDLGAPPFRFVFWSAAYLYESRVSSPTSPTFKGWGGRHVKSSAAGSADSRVALDAEHFAERFGLFIILLLGEVVVEAGEGVADGRTYSAGLWTTLVGAMALSATLWWTYFRPRPRRIWTS